MCCTARKVLIVSPGEHVEMIHSFNDIGQHGTQILFLALFIISALKIKIIEK